MYTVRYFLIIKKGHTVPIHLGSCCAPANPAQESGYLGVNSENLLQIKEAWANGGETKYQLVGDNWDKNILPSYR